MDKVNLAYTSCTRIAGTKEYEGKDGLMHRGALHVTGLRIFAREPKTGQFYENRFLDSAFAAVGKPFLIDRSTPSSRKEQVEVEFPTINEFLRRDLQQAPEEAQNVPDVAIEEEPVTLSEQEVPTQRGNTL